MDIDWIEKMVGRMQQEGVRSMDCKLGDGSFRITLPGGVAPTQAAAPQSAPSAASKAEAGHLLRAGAFGTFHATHPLQSQWGAVPGQAIAIGDVVGFLEVCGVMTAVQSDVPGVVDTVHAQCGQWVQYGDPLLQIRAA